MIKVYISGQITGLNRDEAFQNFENAENQLIDFGLEPVNPMKVCEFNPEWEWHHYMVKDIEALFQCKAILLLPNWKVSKGARIELRIAAEMGLHIFTIGLSGGKNYLIRNDFNQNHVLNSTFRLLDNEEIRKFVIRSQSKGVKF